MAGQIPEGLDNLVSSHPSYRLALHLMMRNLLIHPKIFQQKNLLFIYFVQCIDLQPGLSFMSYDRSKRNKLIVTTSLKFENSKET